MKNEKVRQAINYAVDVDELLKSVLNGHGTKMTGPLSKINSGYVETKDYGFNEEKAKSLLKEAGYKPESLTLTLDTPNGRYPMDSQVAQAIAAQLHRIGIKVNVQVNEWGAHLEKIRNRKMKDMFILGWGPAFNQQSTIENLFTKVAPYSSFYDKDIEKKIYETNALFNEDERFKGYAELQNSLAEKATWVPLWQQGDLYAVRKDLNFKPRVDEKVQAFEMSWK
jgi:peptide/nickel transport system substrate-binding protein